MANVGKVKVQLMDIQEVTDTLIELRTRNLELETAILKYKDQHTTRNMFAMFDLVEEI